MKGITYEDMYGISLPRNFFDLSQSIVFTANTGLIYPIYQLLLMPDDLIEVESELVARQIATLAPSYANFVVKTYDIVVSLRSLFKDIYRFMSGFKEYTTKKKYEEPLPRWTGETANKRAGELWDFLENPINCLPTETSQQLDFYRQAYGYIWDMLFRNEARQDSILVDGEPGSWKGESLLRINWDRDYFTTSLPSPQLGEPIGIPITGIGSAVWEDFKLYAPVQAPEKYNVVVGNKIQDTQNKYNIQVASNTTPGTALTAITDLTAKINNNTIDFKNAGSLFISQIRESTALQVFGEINAIAGIKDDEFLKAHYGTAPKDENLLYPEVFGKNVINLLTSAITQTSETTETSQLGDLAGQGLAVGESKRTVYHAKEFGIYFKLLYVKPNTMYGNQGSKKEYTQVTKFDFPLPILNHMSMQPIEQRELVATSKKFPQWDGTKTQINYTIENPKADQLDKTIIGYAEPYEWGRQKMPRVNGFAQLEIAFKPEIKSADQMTTANLDYVYNDYNWTEARYFSIAEDGLPKINDDFLKCKLDNRNYHAKDDRVLKYDFIIWHNNKVKAWRTLSQKGMPSSLGILLGV